MYMGTIVAAEAATMTSAITEIMSVVTTVMSTITGNAILLTFFCASIVGIAIGIVKRLRAK